MAKTNVREGGLLVWHGQEHMASIIDEMGGAKRHKCNDNNPICMLFDNHVGSWYQSSDSFLQEPKSLRIEFKVSPI